MWLEPCRSNLPPLPLLITFRSIRLTIYHNSFQTQCDWTRIKYNPVDAMEWPNDLSTRSIQGTELRSEELYQVIQFPIPLEGKQRTGSCAHIQDNFDCILRLGRRCKEHRMKYQMRKYTRNCPYACHQSCTKSQWFQR